MKNALRLAFAVALALALAACNQTIQSPAASTAQSKTPAVLASAPAVRIAAPHRSGQLIVGYQDQATVQAVFTALGGGSVLGTVTGVRASLIQLPSGTSVGAAMGELAAAHIAGLRYADPNYTHTLPKPVQNVATQALNDPLLNQKWDDTAMNAQAAWDTNVTGTTKPDGSGVVIGILDTGIDGTNPDLAGKFVPGYNYCTQSGNVPGTIAPGADSTGGSQFHGTHVAGIAAASGNNGQGVAGVAYKAKIMDLKVFCGSSGTTDDFAMGWTIDAAVRDDNNSGYTPDVINMSIGGKGYSQFFKSVLDEAQTGYDQVDGYALAAYDNGAGGGTANDGIPDRSVTFAVAMGNSGQDEVEYPAAYPGMIAVGATDPNGVANFSTRGSHISVAAPGVDILSTWPLWERKPDGTPYIYYRISGTSMATPEVTGAIALIKQFFPGATPYEVRDLLQRTATDIGPTGFDNASGYGLINLKALADEMAKIEAGNASLTQGGVADVHVTSKNSWDSNADGTVNGSDSPLALSYVDVALSQNGVVKYVAQTGSYFDGTFPSYADSGHAFFANIKPGTYQVLVAGQDTTTTDSPAYNSGSWDQATATGTVTVTSGSTMAPTPAPGPDTTSLLLDSTMKVTLSWTGGGDLDLAVQEPTNSGGTAAFATVKTATAVDGTFSSDNTGTNPASASETYTLNATHVPSGGSYNTQAYMLSIDATHATTGQTATLSVTVNGTTHTYGPIPVTPGTSANYNLNSMYFNGYVPPWGLAQVIY